jgi:hypothetical protein
MNTPQTVMRSNGSDEYETPPEAIAPLLPYIPKDWMIWECACGQNSIANELIRHGFSVWGTDKEYNFLTSKIDRTFVDCIITNPPYSLKNEFIERCYEHEKPFALLLPLTALEGQVRQEYFRKHGVELILFNKRIDYRTFKGVRNRCWFPSAWFTWGLNLPRELNFVEI